MENDPEHIFFGNRIQWDQEHPFGLGAHERGQHVYIIGQTGAGKSTLIENLVVQDIQAGRGIALLDPHGDLSNNSLNHIPPSRMEDVVYFDPAAGKPSSLNLFRATTNDRHVVASGIVSAFKKIWGDSWGPRLEYVLYATVASLLHCENTSLLCVSRMLYDERYRAWVVRQVKDPMLVSFWNDEFARFDKSFRQEMIAPIQNKVGQLFLSPTLRHVLGQVGTNINFRSIMDRKQIFIANLSKGRIGELHSILLGALLVTGFELAALSRADIPAHARHRYFLYADEFQNFATDSFASILSEARKYGLCLTLAHQYLDQLPEGLRKAIFGNVGSMIAFRISESDGSALERQFGRGYTANIFTGLGNFELCARLLHQEPFLGRSLPPLSSPNGRRDAVAKRSRQQYGTKRKVVERRIESWLNHRH